MAGFQIAAPGTEDVASILKLMEPYVRTGDLLPRTALDIIANLTGYVVARDPRGTVVAVGCLKLFTPVLGEVAALAVAEACQGRGVGRIVVERLMQRAIQLGVHELFALTRRPAFFHRLGFTTVEKDRFPPKVWNDCNRCPRRDACDEIAVWREVGVVRGRGGGRGR